MDGNLHCLSLIWRILGCGLSIVGFTLLWSSWYALGWAALFTSMIHLMIPVEEEYLRKAYKWGTSDTLKGFRDTSDFPKKI